MAVLCHEHKLSSMKMNQYQGDGEFLSVPYSTNETVDGTDQGPELERESDNRVFGVGNSNDVIAFANDSRLQSKPGYELQKLRLELAHSVSELLLTSKHGSNDNDYSINIVRASHMPVSA